MKKKKKLTTKQKIRLHKNQDLVCSHHGTSFMKIREVDRYDEEKCNRCGKSIMRLVR